MKNLLKVERAKRNLTQAELANPLTWIIHKKWINSIELGKFIPSTVLALRLPNYCNVKVEDIFFLEEDEK